MNERASTSFDVGDRRIGRDAPPFVIAELSGNHNGSLERALALVDAAADAGAHAVKIQTYTPDTITLDVRRDEFLAEGPWAGRTLHDLYGEAQTPWDWHEAIFARCRERGVIGFSTPFDPTAVELLERLAVPLYKIASFEIVDLPLIRLVASTGRPMIMSTGMATIAEIGEAVDAARDAGCRDLVLLRCTSSYPAPPDASDLATLPHMRELFGCEVGLSDHTLGIGVAVASVALGGSVIEKHMTWSRAEGGVDAAFSLEPSEFGALVAETDRAWRALGSVRYGPRGVERASMKSRRSLYVVRDVKAGEVLTTENLRSIRPGFGLPPKHLEALLGQRVTRDVERGTPASWDLVR